MIPILPCRSIDDQLAFYEMRADVALAMDDDGLAASLLAEVARTELTDEDRTALADELARAEDLRQTLA